jgi:hypothetical protein
MRRLVGVAGAVVAALVLASCGNDSAPGGDETPGTAASTPADAEPTGGDATGSGCGVISVDQVSAILGEAYVETPTNIAGAGPDGSYSDQDGFSGFSCLFSPADGDVHDLSVTTFIGAPEMYQLMVDGGLMLEDTGGTPVAGLGTQAQLFRDEIEVTVVAQGADGTVAVVTLTNLDGSPVENQVVEVTRIVLGG